MVKCPLCDAVLDAESEELEEGDTLMCEECGATLEVVGLNPVELVESVEEYDELFVEDEDDLWRELRDY
jgi:alpha-aminoadipate carrier protein LysW